MVDSMVTELTNVSELLAAQVKAGLDRTDVLESLSRSWIARLQNQPKLSTTDKMKLTDAINACPWTERKSLAQIVLANGSKDASASGNKTTQKCHNFENFIQTDIVVKLKARTTTKVMQANGEWILQDSANFLWYFASASSPLQLAK